MYRIPKYIPNSTSTLTASARVKPIINKIPEKRELMVPVIPPELLAANEYIKKMQTISKIPDLIKDDRNS